jgi:hypothetical protein
MTLEYAPRSKACNVGLCVAGWILLFAIAAVSLVPAELRPEINLPNDLEHAAIFFLAGCAFGVGYPNGFPGWLLGPAAFTLAIEITQLWIPGVTLGLLDFVIDAVSTSIGLAIGAMWLALASEPDQLALVTSE